LVLGPLLNEGIQAFKAYTNFFQSGKQSKPF